MKTKFTITFVTLIIGWLLLACAFLKYASDVDTAKALAFIAITVCLFGAMYFNTMLNSKQFWMSQKELDEKIVTLSKRIELYDKATNELSLFIIEHSKIGKKGKVKGTFEEKMDALHKETTENIEKIKENVSTEA